MVTKFPRVQRLPQYAFSQIIAQMKQARRTGEDIIDFGMGNPDGPPPAHVVEKLTEAIQNPRSHRYSVSKGIINLRRAICAWYKRRYDVELDPDSEAIVTMGAKEGFSHLMLAILEQESPVLVPSPSYPIHSYAPLISCGDIIQVRLSPEEDYLQNVEQAIRESKTVQKTNPKFLVISFPHNPTTAVVDLNFFQQVIDFAREHHLLVIHDFAYADLAFDGYQPPSILQIPGAKDIAVELFSLSKSYNLAGWRFGFVVGNPEMVNALERVKSYLDYGIFLPMQIGAIAALNGPQDCVKDIVENYRGRRDALCRGLDRIGWHITPPKATMFVWAKIPDEFRSMGSLNFAKFLLQEAKVAVSPGIGFGDEGEGYVRFALIENEHRTLQAIRGIKDAFENKG